MTPLSAGTYSNLNAPSNDVISATLSGAWNTVLGYANGHSLLKGAAQKEFNFQNGSDGLVSAQLEFATNARWIPKGPNSNGAPQPIERGKPYLFIDVSVYRPTPLSQPHSRTKTLSVSGEKYNYLLTVASSDSALKELIANIFDSALKPWLLDSTNPPAWPGEIKFADAHVWKPLTAKDIYRMGNPSAARFAAIGREVLLDVPVTMVGPGGVLAEIPVPDEIKSRATDPIRAFLFDEAGPLSQRYNYVTNGSRLRIRGMIVNEGYSHYFIYVHATPEPLPPLTVPDIAASLKKRIPDDWIVTVSNQTIRITSKDNIEFLKAWLPGETQKHFAQRQKSDSKYEITLTFVPRLTQEQIDNIIAERRPFKLAVDATANDQDKIDVAAKSLAKYPLPGFYTETFSIFRHSNGDGWGMVPEKIAREASDVEQLLYLKFHSYGNLESP